ncbi:MAG: DUF433 domain-containing protein [Chloroflexota bacterium]|nr:DUF433 domain-containing protein [Chloroflexota bacterium]
MTTRADRARVTRRRGVMRSVPCVEGTRIPVLTVVRFWRDVRWQVNGPMYYPDLTDEQVAAAVAYWRRWGWWWEARRRAATIVEASSERLAGWLMRGVW